MRTTLSLEDDVLEAAKNYAESRQIALGKAVSDLVRKGLKVRTPTRLVNGFVVFDVPADSTPITSERLAALESDADEAKTPAR